MTGSCVLRETILKGRPLSAAGPRVSLYLSLYLSICVAVQVNLGFIYKQKFRGQNVLATGATGATGA